MPNSWKPEVFVEGRWSANGLRFATEADARISAAELMMRWTLVDDTRAGASDDPPNARWDRETGLEMLSKPAEPAA